MIKSAKTPAERRAQDRLYDIQAAACQLVLEHGYDGFTMDQLAEHVGISRRTLFNVVRDKESAILGPKDEINCHPALESFATSEPSDQPFREFVSFIHGILVDVAEDDPRALECHRLTEQAIAADPKVRHLVDHRFVEITELAAQLIRDRQNWPDGDLRARALASVLLSLVQLSMDEFGKDDRPVGQVFLDVVEAFRSGAQLL